MSLLHTGRGAAPPVAPPCSASQRIPAPTQHLPRCKHLKSLQQRVVDPAVRRCCTSAVCATTILPACYAGSSFSSSSRGGSATALGTSPALYRAPHQLSPSNLSQQSRRGGLLLASATKTKEKPESKSKLLERMRLENDTAPDVVEMGAPDLPRPGQYQQTLFQSFALGGIGLHTGEFAIVCVKPAHAGDGRYFVRVPPGTNSHRFGINQPEEVDEEDLDDPEDTNLESEKSKVELFQDYLEFCDEEDYQGTFDDWLDDQAVASMQEANRSDIANPVMVEMPEEAEEPILRNEQEPMLLATVDNVFETNSVHTVLGEGEFRIASVELLLSALEVCGVDNCRIEIEGGVEVPILDGSSLGWVMEIQFAGLCHACPPDEDRPVGKVALVPKQVVTVRDGDAFITLYPEEAMRLTVGIDEQEDAPVIGKQWFSWSMLEDLHYRHELAGARTYATCPEQLIAMRERGWLLGGSENCMIIGYGDRWYDSQLLRFPVNEPARHAMVDLIGDLALNADGGHQGLPFGHIVAYKADHELQVQFVRALREAATIEEFAEVTDITGPEGRDSVTPDDDDEDEIDADELDQAVETWEESGEGEMEDEDEDEDEGAGQGEDEDANAARGTDRGKPEGERRAL